VISEFKCKTNQGMDEVDLTMSDLPSNVVEGSSRSWVQVTGDIMAPALNNLNNLVPMPTGCGEQNMVGLVPNIYLLNYLDETKDNAKLREKAIRHMQIGYERQQKYRRKDGSYSIWGQRDREGSTWLTAFVVKAFSEASKYIKVDTQKLRHSIEWLIRHTTDGCFDKIGYTHQSSLKGGASKSDSLTPFVLTALLEADQVLMSDPFAFRMSRGNSFPALVKGLECALKKEAQAEDDIYRKTLLAYVARAMLKSGAVGEEPPELLKLEQEIDAAANKTDTTVHWKQEYLYSTSLYKWSTSFSVELTAYNVLRLLLKDDKTTASKAVKWLARQRNSQGGFRSTQDTVVALQALSQFASKVDKIEPNLDFKIVADESNDILEGVINTDNKLLLQDESVPENLVRSTITAELTGIGCGLVQRVVRYNIEEPKPDAPAFELTVAHTAAEKGFADIKICMTYKGNREEREMALLELELLSGFVPHMAENLMNEIGSHVSQVEFHEKKNRLFLYIDKVPEKEHCIQLKAKEMYKFEERKPAAAVLLDYYQTDERVEILYAEK